MQAFTQTFRESKPASLLKMACLSAMEDMLTSVSLVSLLSQIITSSWRLMDNQMKALYTYTLIECAYILVQIIDRN